jgi:PhnB protein
MKLFAQLNFAGNCKQAFEYYEKQLGGKMLALMTKSQAPGASPAGDAFDPVIHARLQIGDTVLIGNDVPAEVHQPMRSVYLYLGVDSTEEAERVYSSLSAGGTVYLPLQETFYASRFGQFRDQFGTLWSLIHERFNA